jgi:hypothetical protein
VPYFHFHASSYLSHQQKPRSTRLHGKLADLYNAYVIYDLKPSTGTPGIGSNMGTVPGRLLLAHVFSRR